MSYRDHKYPTDLDWAALNDLIKGDTPTKVKAGLHIVEFVASRYPGEPTDVQPIGSLPINEAAIEGAAPFDIEEVQSYEEEGVNAKQGFGEIVLILRLLATLRKYAPDFLAFAKKLIGL